MTIRHADGTRMTARALEANANRGRVVRRQMLDYIGDYQAEHGWAPTVREIGAAVGLASPSTTQAHLQTLCREGRLVLGGGPRMIRLTNGHIQLRHSVTGLLPPGARPIPGSSDDPVR